MRVYLYQLLVFLVGDSAITSWDLRVNSVVDDGWQAAIAVTRREHLTLPLLPGVPSVEHIILGVALDYLGLIGDAGKKLHIELRPVAWRGLALLPRDERAGSSQLADLVVFTLLAKVYCLRVIQHLFVFS